MMVLQVYCEICESNLTKAGESEHVCDQCGMIICQNCVSSQGFETICKECAEGS